MSELDDRIERGLEELTTPADPEGAFEGVARRKRRRALVRRAQSATLALAILAGSTAGALALTRAFRGDGSTPAGADDGQLIAFVRNTDDGERLFLMREDGTGVRQLTHGPNDQWEPAWSPDGRWIAFSDSAGDIYKIRPDGSGLTKLSTDGPDPTDQVSEHEPSWSPDGEWIVFSRDPVEAVERPRLAIMRTDGSDVRELDTGPGNAYQPAWSPDGRFIAFVGDRASTQDRYNPEIYVLDTQTNEVGRFTRSPEPDHHPSWSPDGSHIAWSDGDIWLADAGNVTQTNLTPTDHDESQPTWSSDGEWILFSTNVPGEGWDLYRMRPDPDASPEGLTNHPAREWHAAWQPEPGGTPVPGPIPTPTSPATCDDFDPLDQPPPEGRELSGDVDGDGRIETVSIAVDSRLPARCRYSIRAAGGSSAVYLQIRAPGWVILGPELLMLAEIDGRPGLEAVVELSPGAVYRVAQVFAFRDDGGRLKIRGTAPSPSHLFPLEDEIPIGVDCAGEGEIVITLADYSIEQEDTGLDPLPFERTFYRAVGTEFVPSTVERVEIPAQEVVETSGASHYPELGGDALRSCPGIVR